MRTIFSLFAALLLLAQPLRLDAQAGARPAPGMGTVTVFRSSGDNGSAYYLTYQNQTLARLKSGNYVEFQLPEGRQYLLADPKAERLYSLEVKAGAKHYVEVVTSGNLLRRLPGMVTATAAEFESIRSSLKKIPVREKTP